MRKEEILWKVASGEMSVEMASDLLEIGQTRTPGPLPVSHLDFMLEIYPFVRPDDYSPVLRIAERLRHDEQENVFVDRHGQTPCEAGAFAGPKGITVYFQNGPVNMTMPGFLRERVEQMFVSQRTTLGFTPCRSHYYDEP